MPTQIARAAQTAPSYLFVGGSWDGMMLPVADVEKRDYVIKAERTSSSTLLRPEHTLRTQSYKRITMRDADGATTHFFLCGGDVNRPLYELIAGYANLRQKLDSY